MGPVPDSPVVPPAVPVLIGRAPELARLRGAIDATTTGRGRLVMLLGEPGMGKSRLLEEVAAYAQQCGAWPLLGRCGGSATGAFAPWVEIIDAYAARCEPERLAAELSIGAADIALVVPGVRRRLGNLVTLRSIDSEPARFRLFDEIAAFLEHAAARQPLVLLLEDLHWSDTASLLLLEFIARRSAARILVVGTARAAPLNGEGRLGTLLDTLRPERLCECIELRGLSADEARRLLAAAIGVGFDETVVEVLREETDGNPFFLLEVARHLVEEGLITRDPGSGLTAQDLRQIELPEGVRTVIGRRFRRLSAGCQDALTSAAAIGLEFDAATLAQIDPPPAGGIDAVLAEAVAAHVIERVTPTAFRFTHALIPDALYKRLGPARAVDVHRQIADALERLHPNDPPVFDLAHHYYQAATGGEAGKAVEYAVRAGEHACRLTAYEDAVRYYRRALGLLGEGDPTDAVRRCEILLALGDAHWKAGEADLARSTFEDAAASARRCGTGEQLARAALGYGGVLQWTRIVEGETLTALLEEALRGLHDDRPLRTRVLARLPFALYFTRSAWSPAQRARRLGLSKAAEAAARRSGEPATLLWALYNRHYALWEPQMLRERLALGDELARLAAAEGQREMLLDAYGFQLSDRLEAGDGPGLAEAYDAYERLAAELRQPWYRYIGMLWAATRALLAGRFEEGGRLAHDAFAVGRPLDAELALRILGGQLLTQAIAQGWAAQLEDALGRLAGQAQTLEAYRGLLAYVQWARGEPAAARRTLDEFAGDLATLRTDYSWLTSVALLGFVAAECGARDHAATLYDMLRPYAEQSVALSYVSYLGCVAQYLGRLADALGDCDAAAAHYEAALAREAAMGAHPWLAHTQYAYGRALLARGNGTRAAELLGEARQGAAQLGMPGLLANIDALPRPA